MRHPVASLLGRVMLHGVYVLLLTFVAILISALRSFAGPRGGCAPPLGQVMLRVVYVLLLTFVAILVSKAVLLGQVTCSIGAVNRHATHGRL